MTAERCGTAVRLVAFDLDGTLLRGDTVCEGIARRLGHLERMREFERLTEIGAMTAAREELAGYYRQVTTAVLQDCLGTLRLAPGAVEGVRLLRRHDIKVAIVSITWAFAAEWFARRLGADHWIGTGLSPDGLTIAHFWPEDKARWLRELMGRLDLQAGQVAAVGDSWGDLAMLRLVGHPFYVGARPPADLAAHHLPDGDIREIAQAIVGRVTGSPARA